MEQVITNWHQCPQCPHCISFCINKIEIVQRAGHLVLTKPQVYGNQNEAHMQSRLVAFKVKTIYHGEFLWVVWEPDKRPMV